MCLIPATPPALISSPFIIEASNSTFPSSFKTAPLPALNNGESSKTLITLSTTSTAEPLLSNIAYPTFNASESFCL